MDNTNEKLIGKTIKEADIDGFGVYLTFEDGSAFEYNASDGGYSRYAYHKALWEEWLDTDH